MGSGVELDTADKETSALKTRREEPAMNQKHLAVALACSFWDDPFGRRVDQDSFITQQSNAERTAIISQTMV